MDIDTGILTADQIIENINHAVNFKTRFNSLVWAFWPSLCLIIKFEENMFEENQSHEYAFAVYSSENTEFTISALHNILKQMHVVNWFLTLRWWMSFYTLATHVLLQEINKAQNLILIL